MKARMRIIGVLVAAFFIAGSVGVVHSADAVKLRVSNPISATDSQMWSDTGKVWLDAVASRLGGKVAFSEHHGGELISGFGNQPKGIGSGLADFGSVITAYNPSEFPMDTIGGAVHPGVERTTVKAVLMDRILMEEIPAFSEQYAKSNVYVCSSSAAALSSCFPPGR